MIRRVVTCGSVAATLATGAMLLGAEPVAPRPRPPLPVPPIERSAMPPFLARITISGAPGISGVFESCMGPRASRTSIEARAKARPAAASMAGCTRAHETRPDGSIHFEMSCDRAKGAKFSFRIVSDGTPNDLRVHQELYDARLANGAKATIDSHMVRLGPCPADLAPGQMRRAGGPILGEAETARLLEASRGRAP